MLDQLIDRIRSAEFKEYEGCLYVDSIDWSGSSELLLNLRLFRSEIPEAWQISCKHVRDHTFRNHRFHALQLTSDHPVLWPHKQPHAELYLGAAASNPAAVYGSLVAAYLDLVGPWFPLKRFFNYHASPLQLLAAGRGLLASGPVTIIDRLAAVLREFEVRHNTIPLHRLQTGIEHELQALVFGESYIAARQIEAALVTP